MHRMNWGNYEKGRNLEGGMNKRPENFKSNKVIMYLQVL